MNEKEKQIKEIFDDIFEIVDRRYYYDSKWNIHIDHVDLNKLAKGLIKRGYTKNKIPEGSIVLNAKDIETTCKHCRSKYEKIIEDTRKETAEKIFYKLKETLIINNEENTDFFDYNYTLETIDEIAKQFGVEVEV